VFLFVGVVVSLLAIDDLTNSSLAEGKWAKRIENTLEAEDELKPKGKELEDSKRTKDLGSRNDIIAVALKLRGGDENPDSLVVDHCW